MTVVSRMFCLKWKEMPFIAKWVQIENVQTVKYSHGQDVYVKDYMRFLDISKMPKILIYLIMVFSNSVNQNSPIFFACVSAWMYMTIGVSSMPSSSFQFYLYLFSSVSTMIIFFSVEFFSHLIFPFCFIFSLRLDLSQNVQQFCSLFNKSIYCLRTLLLSHEI